MTDQSAHYVYRVYAKGTLIYVGMTSNVRSRIDAHKKKHWWPAHPIIRLLECSTEQAARRLEQEQIEKLKPVENIHYSADRSYTSSLRVDSSVDPMIPVLEAIEFFGSQAEIVRCLGLTRAGVSCWPKDGYVPALSAYRLCTRFPELGRRYWIEFEHASTQYNTGATA